MFLKPLSALIADGAAIERPAGYERVDYEGELGVVIGQRARARVAGSSALDSCSAYTMRERRHRARPAEEGRPVDAREGVRHVLPDRPAGGRRGSIRRNLRITTRVNGVVKQDSSTSDLIFDVATLIAFCLAHMTLEPGDVISTGTPSGVGNLIPGDVVEIEIAGIGVLANPVDREPRPCDDVIVSGSAGTSATMTRSSSGFDARARHSQQLGAVRSAPLYRTAPIGRPSRRFSTRRVRVRVADAIGERADRDGARDRALARPRSSRRGAVGAAHDRSRRPRCGGARDCARRSSRCRILGCRAAVRAAAGRSTLVGEDLVVGRRDAGRARARVADRSSTSSPRSGDAERLREVLAMRVDEQAQRREREQRDIRIGRGDERVRASRRDAGE